MAILLLITKSSRFSAKMKRFFSLGAALFVGILLLSGCGGEEKPKLDLETGRIDAPSASPPILMTPEPETADLRADPMAPPTEVPATDIGESAEKSEPSGALPVEASPKAITRTKASEEVSLPPVPPAPATQPPNQATPKLSDQKKPSVTRSSIQVPQ